MISMQTPASPFTVLRAPRAIIERLNTEINRALVNNAVEERWRAIGFEPATMSIDEFTTFHPREGIRWGEIVRLVAVRMTQ